MYVYLLFVICINLYMYVRDVRCAVICHSHYEAMHMMPTAKVLVDDNIIAGE